MIPAQRLDHGTDLGMDFVAGLSTSAQWVVGQNPDTAKQNGTWQVGAKIYKSAHNNPIPVYVSSAIENASPSMLEITYSLTLANIIPATSAFAVSVNSAARSVSSVTVSGTRVILTLSGPVIYGDLVTVAYTKPSVNPLQTSAGGQAESITAQTVTNRVAPPVPTYVNSAIENASPSTLEMTYSLTLANIVPAVSAFTINVNSVTRSVTSVTVSGTKVMLTLASPVVYGDLVTVAYTKPAVNPLQTTAGGQAESLTSQSVANNCVAPPNLPPVVIITSPGNNSTFEAPVSITLTADASDADGYVSKVEYFIGSAKIGESHIAPYSFSFDCSNAGTFEISAVATDNLNSSSTSFSISISVTLKNDYQYTINLFPNPNNGRFSIDFYPSLPDLITRLTIVNQDGRTVYKGVVTDEISTREIDLSDSAAGTYVLILTLGNNIVATTKFVKK
jgi:uncharacterized repeat protein (TIGR02059 family)